MGIWRRRRLLLLFRLIAYGTYTGFFVFVFEFPGEPRAWRSEATRAQHGTLANYDCVPAAQSQPARRNMLKRALARGCRANARR